MTIEVLEVRPIERGSLKAFAKIRVPQWRLSIDDVALHEANGKWWCSLPARPQLDQNRNVAKDDTGKVKYVKSLWFDDRTTADRFSAAVVAEALKQMKKPAAVEDDGLSDFTL